MRSILITPLCEMQPGQEADAFALLSAKEPAATRSGKPFFRVTFRDAVREVTVPIWADSAYYESCKNEWSVGQFYKLRAVYQITSYGPQLDIRKIREVNEDDVRDGFDPAKFRPSTEFDPQRMHEQLVTIAEDEIHDQALSRLVAEILTANRETLLVLPAASSNHHAFAGGFLEHVLSVTRNARFLAEKYQQDYSQMQPPLSRDLVLAGAILHDIGKLRELQITTTGAEYSAQGELIGHVLLGRDIVREASTACNVDEETLLRLEHIIVSHQRLPEWGSPKPPMTPEAILVHYADDLDAKFHMALVALRDDPSEEAFTSSKNPLRQKFYRGADEKTP